MVWNKRIAPCRACQRLLIVRCRGLCSCCYDRPEVKAQYPSVSKYSQWGVGQEGGSVGMPVPTRARPGTEDKVRVMEERALRREYLFHPEDARLDLL